jgi:HipA-like kinase
MLRTHRAVRILTADKRGSSWPVRSETDDGVFLTKLRGAGHGAAALVAEVIVARLAAVLGLKVPPMALITLGEGVDTLDRRDELADLLQASRGVNLGFRYLDGARDLRADETGLVDEETASKIVWLDGLVLNPDRTPKNPNLLWFRNTPWLIDHGASLRFHHDWAGLTEPRIREPHDPRVGHLFGLRARFLAEVDEPLARVLTRHALEEVMAAVPGDFLTALPGPDPLPRRRAAYVAVLWKRLKSPRPFVPVRPSPLDPNPGL